MAVAITTPHADRLESFGIYQIACQLFKDFWTDSEILGTNFPTGRPRFELPDQPAQSNIQSQGAFLPLRVGGVCGADGERAGVRCSSISLQIHGKDYRGRFQCCHAQLFPDLIQQRAATLDHIIGGLTNTINTIEAKQKRVNQAPAPRQPSPATRHSL